MILTEKLLQKLQALPDEKKQQRELGELMDEIIDENKQAFVELANGRQSW